MIESFQIETEHSAGAVNFESLTVLEADGEAGRLKSSHAAVLEPSQSQDHVIHFAPFNEGVAQSGNLLDLPVQVESRVDKCDSKSPATPEPALRGSMRHVAVRRASAPHCCR